MTDSTRRSGRATKGQHRGFNDGEIKLPIKSNRGRKASKTEQIETEEAEQRDDPDIVDEIEDDGDAIIRCICGATSEDPDDDRKMICCEKCDAWQHNECMEMSENDDELPEKYFCEQCRPKDHKPLLEKIARGERPWEKNGEQLSSSSRSKPKRGPKRTSGLGKEELKNPRRESRDGEFDLSEHIKSKSHTPDLANGDPSGERTAVKRKLQLETSPRHADPKHRKSSTSTATTKTSHASPNNLRRTSGKAFGQRESGGPILQAELVSKIDELLSKDRRSVAQEFTRVFEAQVKQAQSEGAFSLPEGQIHRDFALKLALSVEYAMYLNFFGNGNDPSDQYRDKFRAIRANVKQNVMLRDQILKGELSPNDLSKMSSEDMASKELQQKKAEMLKEAEKQHMLIQDDGPRIRRTHKGEELIDDEKPLVDAGDTMFSAPMRKRPSQIDTTMTDASPAPLTGRSPSVVESTTPIQHTRITTPESIKHESNPSRNIAIDQDKKPNSSFNIRNVWSEVKGPESSARPPSRPSENPQQAIRQQADADIDHLLKDEDDDEEEAPYSPVDYSTDTDQPVWRGRMMMTSVANFTGQAKHVAGADLSKIVPWAQLFADTLVIEGRIDTARADEYLCGLRYSNSTDIVVTAVTPSEAPDSRTQFDKLFKYFTDRNRYGVVARSPVPNVRDVYVVPLEKGAAKMPEMVELLDHCVIKTPCPERLLLLIFVVKTLNSPTRPGPPPAYPLTMSNNAQPSLSGAQNTGQEYPQRISPATTPMTRDASPYSGTSIARPQSNPQYASASPQPILGYAQPSHQQSPPIPPGFGNAPKPPPVGMEAARQALGELANAPSIPELIKEAPMSGVSEFLVVKELLQNVPASRYDYGMLKGMLNHKIQEQIRH